MSSGRRGGQRSGTNRPKGRTKEQLYNEAKRMNIDGPLEDEQAAAPARGRRQEVVAGYSPGVRPETLDHVALWVAERDRIADFVTERVGMHVVDRTDAFTLVGSDARRGKLTLFAAEGPREQGALKHVALRVSSIDRRAGRAGRHAGRASSRGRGVLRRRGRLAARAGGGADRGRIRPRPRRALVALAEGDRRRVRAARVRAGADRAGGRAASRGRAVRSSSSTTASRATRSGRS